MDPVERGQQVAATVTQLRAHMRRMERRFGCTSEEMWDRWQAGDEPEDQSGQDDVFDWMMNWRLLRDIVASPAFDGLIPPDDPTKDETAAETERAAQARLASQWRIASPDVELEELRANIETMELRYECTSEHMWNAVLAGTERETDEICLWLMDYYRLKQIAAAADPNGSGATPLSTSGAWTASTPRES